MASASPKRSYMPLSAYYNITKRILPPLEIALKLGPIACKKELRL